MDGFALLEAHFCAPAPQVARRVAKALAFGIDADVDAAELPSDLHAAADAIADAIARVDPAGPLRGLRAVAKARANAAAGQLAVLAALVLQRCRPFLECLPDFCKAAFLAGADVEAAAAELHASPPRFSTPLRKANLGSTGSDPAMRLGPKTYSDREAIRDALSSIHEDGYVAFDIALEKVVSHLDNPANFAWTAGTVTDFYLRTCFNVKDYEDQLLRASADGGAPPPASGGSRGGGGGEVEQALWLRLCRALALRHAPLWLALLNGAVDRLVQLLIALDDETNAAPTFLSARYLAHMLAYCSFEVHAGIVVPPHNLFDALLYCDAAAASLKLLFSAFVLSEYVARVPLELRNGNAHCHRVRTLLTLVRRRTVDCKTALFVAQQCAPVALGDGDVASRAADFAHVASVAFDDVTDAIVAHPQFVMLFWPQVLAHTSRSAPAPRATEQQPQSDEAELKKKSKYWFFRTHHQLLPLIHCVARCVAANATARCVGDPRHNQRMASNPELLGLALAQSRTYLAQVVPQALQLLVPISCETRALSIAESECVSLAAELTESALFDVVSRPPTKTASEPRRVAPSVAAEQQQQQQPQFGTDLPRSPFCSNANLRVTPLSVCEELQWLVASAPDSAAALDALLSNADYVDKGPLLRDALLGLARRLPAMRPLIVHAVHTHQERFPPLTFFVVALSCTNEAAAV